MAEKLSIEIDIGDSKAKIDELKASWTGMVAQLANVSKAAGGVERLTAAMKGIPTLPSNAFDAIKNLSTAIAGVQTDSIGTLASGLNRLAKVDMSLVTSNIQALGNALANLKVPPGLQQISDALGNLARSVSGVQAAAGAIRAVHAAADPTSKAVNSLGRELINIAGFSSGLSTTLGNLVNPLRAIISAGTGVRQILSEMVTQFGMVGTAIAAFGASAAIFVAIKASVGALLSTVIQTGTEFQSFIRTMDAVRGAGGGTKAFEALKKIAKETGQSVASLSTEFKQFDVAASQSGMTAEQSAKIFKQVSTGLSVIGVDSVKARFAFMALQQMMSKGVVSMEELRRQLGDSIPGAVGLFAQAMGVSQQELIKMVEAGKVITKDVLPKFGDLLEQKFGSQLPKALEQAQAKMNEFATTVQLVTIAFGEGNFGGIMAGFAAGLDKLNNALGSHALESFARVLGDLVGLLTGTVIGAIGGFLSGVTDFIGIFTRAVAAVANFGQSIASFIGWITGLGSAFSQLPTPVQAVVNLLSRLAEVLGFLGAGWLAVTIAINGFAIAAAVGATVLKGLNAAMTLTGLPTLTVMFNSASVAVTAFIARVGGGAGVLAAFNAALLAGATGIRAYAASITLATVATTAFNIALKLAGIGLIIGGIVALSAGIEALIGWFSKGTEEVKKFDQQMVASAASTEGFGQNVADALSFLAGDIWDKTAERAKIAWDQIKNGLKSVGDTILEGVQNTWNLLPEWLTGTLAQGFDVAVRVAENYGTKIYNMGVRIINTFLAMNAVLQRFFDWLASFSTKSAPAKNALTELQAGGMKTATSLNEVQNGMKKAGDAAGGATSKFKGAGQAAKEAGDGMGKAGKGADSFLDKMIKATQAGSGMGEAFRQIKAKGEELDFGAPKSAIDSVSEALERGKENWARMIDSSDTSSLVQSANNASIATEHLAVKMAAGKVQVSEWGQNLEMGTGIAREAAAASQALGTATQNVATGLGNMNDQIVVMAGGTSELAESQQQAVNSTENWNSQIEVLAGNYDEAITSTQALGNAMSGLSGSLASGLQSTDKLDDVTVKLNAATIAADASTDAFEGAMEAAKNQAEAYSDSLDGATESAMDLINAQSQIDSGGGGGGGGDSGGISEFREGGRVGEAVSSQRVSLDAFANAPKLAGGMANTNSLRSQFSGGGKAAILHPNEAVVPLSRGRSIPVELSASDLSAMSGMSTVAPSSRSLSNDVVEQMGVTTTRQLKVSQAASGTLDDINKNLKELGRANKLTGGTIPPPTILTKEMMMPLYPKGGPKPGHVLESAVDMTGQKIPGVDMMTNRESMGTSTSTSAPAAQPRARPIININIPGKDLFDKFRYTHDQIAKQVGEAVDKAIKKNG